VLSRLPLFVAIRLKVQLYAHQETSIASLLEFERGVLDVPDGVRKGFMELECDFFQPCRGIGAIGDVADVDTPAVGVARLDLRRAMRIVKLPSFGADHCT
jgi:hypothetical protein